MSDKNTDETKGRLKESAGALTGDDKLKREGKTDQASATVKDGIDKVTDKLKGK